MKSDGLQTGFVCLLLTLGPMLLNPAAISDARIADGRGHVIDDVGNVVGRGRRPNEIQNAVHSEPNNIQS